ncbi:hemolysin III family protein [Mesonia sp.]|uniref:PAQR family membrane homeostasis protein TrhA n=1 Tax=Mesonia sp. TaxID=1960830 RepID=UPI0017566B2E|nr:hemolysin III family protein [Mesonia sp.]HIB37109.1 hemolysin III family protein [Mesonia sp.]
MRNQPSYYSYQEERLNVISHAIGFGLSLAGLIFILVKSISTEEALKIISSTVYALSMIILYGASTFYHYSKSRRLRYKLNILDHAAIYVLIAGTYTPFTLITLSGSTGVTLFISVWLMAIVGVVLKLFYTGKFKLLSTIMYVLMGWLVIFAIKPLVQNLDISGVYLLFGGGLAYTLGAILFMFDKIKFNHAIFHIFVLVGSFFHFLAIYFYVI